MFPFVNGTGGLTDTLIPRLYAFSRNAAGGGIFNSAGGLEAIYSSPLAPPASPRAPAGMTFANTQWAVSGLNGNGLINFGDAANMGFNVNTAAPMIFSDWRTAYVGAFPGPPPSGALL